MSHDPLEFPVIYPAASDALDKLREIEALIVKAYDDIGRFIEQGIPEADAIVVRQRLRDLTGAGRVLYPSPLHGSLWCEQGAQRGPKSSAAAGREKPDRAAAMTCPDSTIPPVFSVRR